MEEYSIKTRGQSLDSNAETVSSNSIWIFFSQQWIKNEIPTDIHISYLATVSYYQEPNWKTCDVGNLCVKLNHFHCVRTMMWILKCMKGVRSMAGTPCMYKSRVLPSRVWAKNPPFFTEKYDPHFFSELLSNLQLKYL